jgi:hypothetical protein
MTIQADIKVRLGTNKPDVAWLLQRADGSPFAGAGSEFELKIYRGSKALLELSTSDGGLIFNPTTGQLRWIRTIAESRLIPAGWLARYEVARLFDGNRTVPFEGYVIGLDSQTDDELDTGIDSDDPQLVIVQIAGEQGPPGPPGPAAGGQARSYPVAVPISGHRGVRLSNGNLLTVSPDEPTHADTCFGITTGGGAAGSYVEVRSGGVMDEPSWNWSPGPIFLGLDGVLTQAPKRAAFEQRVGFAAGPTAMLVAIEPAILLAH